MECSWPAIIKFFTFKVKDIVFADIFVFIHQKKTTVLPYNHLRFQVQVLGVCMGHVFKSVLKQFLGAFLCPVM